MLRFRELEHTSLYSGLGVRLVDDFTKADAFGPYTISVDIGDNGTFRELPGDVYQRTVTAGGITWFPWLEHYADARGKTAREYRVRVTADHYTPAYAWDSEGVTTIIEPYDDVTEPGAFHPVIEIPLLPAASYPFDARVPLLRGAIEDIFGDRVPLTRVTWIDTTFPAPVPPLVTDTVLSDADGEFILPMSRAPLGVNVDVFARRPPPPFPGKQRKVSVSLPADLSTFHVITIL